MPRGERGGKKTSTSKKLTEQTIRGEHVPKTEPSSAAGLERLDRVRGEVATRIAASKASSSSVAAEEPEFPDFDTLVDPEEIQVQVTIESSSVRSFPQAEGSKAPSSKSKSPVLEGPPKSKTPQETTPQTVPEVPKAKELVLPRATSVVKPAEPPTAFFTKAAGIPKAVVVPKAVAIPKTFRPVTHPPDLTVAPKTPEKAKGKALLIVSNPVLNPAPAIYEVRVSVDFNGVLNVGQAGDAEYNGIHPHNLPSIRQFLLDNAVRGFRLVVTSFIGTTGAKSQERRLQLLNEVRVFNQGTQDPRFRLGLKIVNTRDKGQFLNVAGTTVHIDDRLDCLDSCEASIHTFWVTARARYHRKHHILASLREALDQVASDRSIQATLQQRQFGSHWQIPL